MTIPNEQDIIKLLIEELDLEVEADEIDGNSLLFDEIGLDSIDALEIGMIMKQRFSIAIENLDMEIKKRIFTSVGSLHQFIAEELSKQENQPSESQHETDTESV